MPSQYVILIYNISAMYTIESQYYYDLFLKSFNAIDIRKYIIVIHERNGLKIDLYKFL